MELQSLITLGNAAKLCPGGKTSTHSLWRWARKGVRSRGGCVVRLEHFRVGGRIYTTRDALTRFFSALAEADAAYFDSSSNAGANSGLACPQSNVDRRLAQANQLLDQAGF